MNQRMTPDEENEFNNELQEMFDILKGKYKHYCQDWDGLPIDETCGEFKACGCYIQLNNEGKQI